MILDSQSQQKKETNVDWIWWKHGVVYHIYPLSFFDSNNDGKGDLRGIIQKLGYLQNLGVDAIWLSPVFRSPMAEFGYDVSDYYTIDPVFGSLDDFREILHEAHARNIRVILDMVLNHTSSQHPWFVESKSSKENPKRNWYIWEPPKNGRKPNNWKTAFGGSCWEFCANTGEYYLHSFLKDQPDLNWRNKELRIEMFGMLSFWLETGVDGFRFDVINFIVKDKKLRNNPFLFWQPFSRKIRTRNQPKSYKIIRKLRELLNNYPERMSVGEIYALPPGDPGLAASYLSEGNNSLHLTFDFSIFFVYWSARKYFKAIEKWQNSIPPEGWPTNVFSNHDLFRSFNRKFTGRNPDKKARLIALLLMTLRGTPFVYYGEEIGMKNARIPKHKIQDPLGKKFWPFFKGRDRARTPMQWNEEKSGGFSLVEPWLPLNDDFKEKNVENEMINQESLLNLYRNLIKLRKQYIALNAGDWIPDCPGKNGIISFYRKNGDEKLLIVLNFTSRSKTFNKALHQKDKIIFSTVYNTNASRFGDLIYLQPYEGIVLLTFA